MKLFFICRVFRRLNGRDCRSSDIVCKARKPIATVFLVRLENFRTERLGNGPFALGPDRIQNIGAFFGGAVAVIPSFPSPRFGLAAHLINPHGRFRRQIEAIGIRGVCW